MRVIIAGGRNFEDYRMLHEGIVDSEFDITEVVSGGARGADLLGERWAKDHGIPVKRFPAKWNRQPDGSYDKGAGFKRNEEMARYADALIAMPGGNGTADMIRRARNHGLKVYVAA